MAGKAGYLLGVLPLLAAIAVPHAAPAAKRAGKTVLAKPDLAIARVIDPPTKIAPGSSFVAVIEVKNRGAKAAAASRVGFFLSADAKRSSDDLALGTTALGVLAKGRSAFVTLRIDIGAAAPIGVQRLIGCVDVAAKIRESSETNNCRAATGSMSVIAQPQGGPGGAAGQVVPGGAAGQVVPAGAAGQVVPAAATPSLIAFQPSSPSAEAAPLLTGAGEPGSIVSVHRASCDSTRVAATVVGADGLFAVAVPAAPQAPVTFVADAAAGGPVSGCSAGLVYVHDSLAPDVTSLNVSRSRYESHLVGDPGRELIELPARAGGIPDDWTLELHSDGGCGGAPTATRAAGDGIEVLLQRGIQAFSGRVIDGAGNATPCLPMLRFFTFVRPAAPTLDALTPASPNRSLALRIALLSAAARVYAYAGAECAGDPIGAVPPVDGRAAFDLTAAANMATTFSFRAFVIPPSGATPWAEPALGSAGCTPATYAHDDLPPTVTGLSTTPASPSSNTQPVVTVNGPSGPLTGVTTRLYVADAQCAGTPVATGPNGSVSVSLPVEATSRLTARALDAAGNVSACVGPLDYVTAAPVPAPTGLFADPAGPSPDATPTIHGLGRPGLAIELFDDADCTGLPDANGTIDPGGAFVVDLAVAPNALTSIAARVRSPQTGMLSTCSATLPYRHDGVAPAIDGLRTSPVSPSDDLHPLVSVTNPGGLEPGARLRIYVGGTACGGTPAATSTGAPVAVDVGQRVVSAIRADAVDVAGNVSACAGPLSYSHVDPPHRPYNMSTAPAVAGQDPTPRLSGYGEAGTAVSAFIGDGCTGTAVATTTVTNQGLFALDVPVPLNPAAATAISVRARDAGTNVVSQCMVAPSYRHDDSAPAIGSLTASPASPSSSTYPTITVRDPLGAPLPIDTVLRVFVGAPTCAGAPERVINVNPFTYYVASDTTTTITVTAQDAVGNRSDCSPALAYRNVQPPSDAFEVALSPASASPDATPTLTGRATPGNEVLVFVAASVPTCNEVTPALTTTVAPDGTFAVDVPVATNAASQIRARVRNPASGGSSAGCASLFYTHDDRPPVAGTLTTTPASPGTTAHPTVAVSGTGPWSYDLHRSADCSGDVLASGADPDAAAVSGSGVSVEFESTTSFSFRLRDAAGNSVCAGPVVYSHAPPVARPAIAGFSPATPSQDRTPTLTGTAAAGRQVRVFATDCAGTLLATTIADGDGSWTVDVTVPANGQTRFAANARSVVTAMTSSCAVGAVYTHDDQITTPVVTGFVVPEFQAVTSPQLHGTGDVAAGIDLFAASDCGGPAVATTGVGSAGTFIVSVPPVRSDAESIFSIRSDDFAGNVSPCVGSLRYSTRRATAEVEPNETLVQAAARSEEQLVHASGDRRFTAAIATGTDSDNFRVVMSRPGALRVETYDGGGFECSGGIDTLLLVYDEAGVTVGNDDDSGRATCSRIRLPNLRAGTYYVRVLDFGQNSAIPSYSLDVDFGKVGDVPELEPNDSTALADARTTGTTHEAVSLLPRGSASGYLTGPWGDLADVIRMNVAAPTLVRAESSTRDNGECGEAAPRLEIATTGAPIQGSQELGDAPCEALYADLAAGTPYLRVLPGTPFPGPWHVDVAEVRSDGAEVEPNETVPTATLFSRSARYRTGRIADSADVDVFQFTIPARTPVEPVPALRVDVISAAGTPAKSCVAGSTVMNPRMTIENAQSNVLAASLDDGVGGCPRIDGTGPQPLDESVSALNPGTYYVRVQKDFGSLTFPFDYRVVISFDPEVPEHE